MSIATHRGLHQRASTSEDYEHDLILSPLFTPKLPDRAIFAEVLGRESAPREQVDAHSGVAPSAHTWTISHQ
jgi:hypothetical protein